MLTVDGARVGEVLLRRQVFTPRVGGLLWWSRWGDSVETIEERVVLDDGRDEDALILPANLDAVIGQWASGAVEALGQKFRVEWVARDDREPGAP
ncbi:hypothetical protein [Cellulomonas sp. IC4_254]|uniref:hypothetical protein n=1 Tax=Cellulomonas sp. IC4_254 TaxID=2714040 RepID=UPI00141DCD1C|nr:hypothetical protein [Cellulomonas sp. IC4_254]NHT17074.1 hypothetical protein [Cellulomonas sp. IC4_254]